MITVSAKQPQLDYKQGHATAQINASAVDIVCNYVAHLDKHVRS